MIAEKLFITSKSIVLKRSVCNQYLGRGINSKRNSKGVFRGRFLVRCIYEYMVNSRKDTMSLINRNTLFLSGCIIAYCLFILKLLVLNSYPKLLFSSLN